TPLKHVVLKRKHVNLAIGKSCGVGLLPFGTNRVIDRIADPAAIGVLELYEVPPFFQLHASKEHSSSAGHDLEPRARQSYFVSRIKLRVLEIADHVARLVSTEHARHAGFFPREVLVLMALAAGIAPGIVRLG